MNRASPVQNATAREIQALAVNTSEITRAPRNAGHNARGIHIGVVAGHDGDCLNALFQGVNEAATELRVRVYTG